jgi:hypothetical protein
MALPSWSHDRKCFYKYMTADVAKLVLQNNTLRWALPKLFNDPFNVQFDLRVEYDRGRVIDRALQNLVDLYMGRRQRFKGARATRPITFVRALIRCEPRLGRLPVGGGSQVLGHQQECREDQGVHNGDRDHANGKTAVMVIKVRP